ncbi:TPM domain-containing protein [Microvirga sp. 2YAF29]|uniref:TPM domain-containing protein n=1 Tax=Microvirga sp. 2YAF29 TaxID=3233031 RepID=UPI003F9ACB50
MLSMDDQARLANVIRDVEDDTSGEIVVVLAKQADTYRAIPLLWALLIALALPWPLIELTNLSASRIFMIQLGVALASSLALSLPQLRYQLVPRSIKRAQAHEAASREFIRRGLTRTRDKTGVLIYVALAEHHAEILADTGIADRVGPDVWVEIIEKLTMAIKAGSMADGLAEAIRRAGAILAEHAPPRFEDEDELPNKIILL